LLQLFSFPSMRQAEGLRRFAVGKVLAMAKSFGAGAVDERARPDGCFARERVPHALLDLADVGFAVEFAAAVAVTSHHR
jgi:hypothetical protein